MNLCSNCNSPVDENAKVCPMCGAPLVQEQSTSAPESQPAAVEVDPEYDYAKDVEENKGMAVLSYLSILCLIPLFAAKKSKFASFHANQGLILFLIEVVLGIVVTTLRLLFAVVLPLFFAYRLCNLINLLLLGVYIAFSVLGIVNVINGQMKKLPIIGEIIKSKD